MNCVNILVTRGDEAPRKYRHSSLLDKKRTSFLHPSVVSGDTTTRNNKQAVGINCALTILAPRLNTPHR